MKRSTIISSFLFLISVLPVYPMDMSFKNLSKESQNLAETVCLVNSYSSSTGNRLNLVQEQKKELSKPIKKERSYRDETMVCSLSLHEMPDFFCMMVDSCKRAELKIMPKKLFFIYCVAILLPPRVIRSICLCMCDGNQEKAAYFYTTPIGRALDWYYDEKKDEQHRNNTY